ncbi:unnamed protein product, partial [marine sediment metagenome]
HVGPPILTRFEKTRIVGARALQLSLGAPILTPLPDDVIDVVEIAILELEAKAVPISIRRTLPDGLYMDIPITVLQRPRILK